MITNEPHKIEKSISNDLVLITKKSKKKKGK